jgi:hypothetical protein
MKRGRIGTTGVLFAFVMAGGQASAQVHPMPSNPPFPPGFTNHVPGRDEARLRIQVRLKQLREEAIATQKADGGTLTPEHREQFNERLAALRDEACRVGYAGC